MNTLWMLQQDASRGDQVRDAVVGALGAMSMGLITLVTLASLMGLVLVSLAVAPTLTARAGTAYRLRPFVSFIAGLGAWGAILFLLAAAHKAPPLFLMVSSVSTIAGILAFEATGEALGRKLFLVAGRDATRLGHVLLGWPAYAFACLVPVVGWFVVLPFGLIQGLGSTIVGCLTREDV
jgi:hypothetical protein